MRPVAVRTVKQAGAWLDRVGIALLFARPDVVLPSLWEAVSGDASAPWAIRDADGAFVRWSEAAGICWGLKDELPERGVACVGRHAGGNAVALVAPWALPLLYALTGRAGSETDADRSKPKAIDRTVLLMGFPRGIHDSRPNITSVLGRPRNACFRPGADAQLAPGTANPRSIAASETVTSHLDFLHFVAMQSERGIRYLQGDV